jgi:AraC family transcriptional regulator
MQPRIETLKEKKLVGKRIKMSISNNKTKELWQDFMPRRQEIKNKIGSDLFSVEVYPQNFIINFNPETEFDKWATIEVKNFNAIPMEMETIIFPTGLYAVFIHKGPTSKGPKTYEYIFRTWLPNSIFLLDNRPHFAVMGEKYKQEVNDSEEEIWIPIKRK